ncbi:MAG: hypothetical protein QXU63_04235 [Nitrososphaerota archaeon]
MILDEKKINRREALSTAAKVATGVIVAGVVGGVAGYYAGSSAVPPVTEKTVVTTKTVTEATTVTATVGAPAKKEIIVRAVFQTPVSEPWDGAIHTAILAVKDEFEAKGIKVDYQFVDRKIDPKEYELALEDAAKVADIVFLDAFLKEDIARRVAKRYPKVAFAAGSEYLPRARLGFCSTFTTPSNMAV